MKTPVQVKDDLEALQGQVGHVILNDPQALANIYAAQLMADAISDLAHAIRNQTFSTGRYTG